MHPQFHNHKLLLDENMPSRQTFPRLNELFDVKHIRDDVHGAGLADPQVYELATKSQRLLITYNIKDFEALVTQQKAAGVIGISPNLPLHQLDKKLTAFLTRTTPKSLSGKCLHLTGETEV